MGERNELAESLLEIQKKEPLTKELIENSYYTSKIYSLVAVDIREYTEEELETERKILNLKYNKDLSIGELLEFKRNIGESTFKISSFNVSYFLDEKTAIDYAINNIGGCDEAGCYNYSIVFSTPLNIAYADIYNENCKIFKRNYKKDIYEELETEDKFYEEIKNQFITLP